MSKNQMIEEPQSTNMENTMQEPKKLLERQPKTIKTSLGALGSVDDFSYLFINQYLI